MKSSFRVLDALYGLVNVSAVKNVITGKVFSISVPDGDQKENVSIRTLTNSNTYLQEGYVNLNIHVKEISSGRPNLKRFRELIDIIIPLVKDVRVDTFSFEIEDDKGVFKDQNQDSMYFYNLKIKFQTI